MMNFLESFPEGSLEIEKTFFFYNGPKLFLARNKEEHHYIGVWLGENDDNDSEERWLFLPISLLKLSFVLEGKLTLRDACLSPETKNLICIKSDSETNLLESNSVSPREIAEEDLPSNDSTLISNFPAMRELESISFLSAENEAKIKRLLVEPAKVNLNNFTLQYVERLIEHYLEKIPSRDFAEVYSSVLVNFQQVNDHFVFGIIDAFLKKIQEVDIRLLDINLFNVWAYVKFLLAGIYLKNYDADKAQKVIDEMENAASRRREDLVNFKVSIYLKKALLRLRLNDPKKAFYWIQKGIQFATKNGVINDFPELLYALGNIYDELNEFEKSEQMYLDSLKRFESSKDDVNIAKTYHQLGNLYNRRGAEYFEKAISYYNISIALCEKLGLYGDLITNHNNLASLYIKSGNYPEAIKNFEICLSLCDQVGAQFLKSGIHLNLGNYYMFQVKHDLARGQFEKSLSIYEEFKSSSNPAINLGNIYNQIALLDYKIGDKQSSLENLKKAKSEFEKLPNMAFEIESISSLIEKIQNNISIDEAELRKVGDIFKKELALQL